MKCASRIWLLLLLGSISLPAAATAVHSWVDADGVTHFSDALPAGGDAEVSTVELDDDFPPVADPEGDYYSIANQWKRMREERETKTRLRLEKDRIRVSESAAPAYAEPPPEYAAYHRYPVYTQPYGYPYAYGGAVLLPYGHRNTVGRGRHHVNARGGHIAGSGWYSRGVPRRGVGLRGGYRSGYHGGSGFGFGFNLR